jgi:predicted TIM-barrel fold metal-dependent hydrolase
LFSPVYLNRLGRRPAPNPRSDSALLDWSPARAVEEMDRTGISTAMLSIAVAGISFDGGEAARSLVRGNNDFGAKMVRDFPGRFGLFASLPLPDQDGSLREIEYAFDVLKADGVAIVTDYGDKWPGDPAYVPTFEELDRRKAVVFVHPTTPSCCSHLIPNVPPGWLEYDFDSARAITSFLVNGTFERFPNLRFILTHSGGAMPALAGRVSALISKELADRVAPKGVSYELKKLYFDVANGANPPALAALMGVSSTTQMLFGTDYPLVTVSTTVDGLDRYGFSEADLEAINRDNAIRLFPRLKG